MNTGTALAIGAGLLLFSRKSSAASSPAGSSPRPGSTAAKAQQGGAKSGASGFPSPFPAGAGRGGASMGDASEIIDVAGLDLFNTGSVIDFPEPEVDVPSPDFSVGFEQDNSVLDDLTGIGLATPDNPGVVFHPDDSGDFGYGGDPGIDSGAAFDEFGSGDSSGDF